MSRACKNSGAGASYGCRFAEHRHAGGVDCGRNQRPNRISDFGREHEKCQPSQWRVLISPRTRLDSYHRRVDPEMANTIIPSDTELVGLALSGDTSGLEGLYSRYFDRLFDFAARTVKDKHVAGDIVQDSFIKAYERLGNLRDPEAFRPWMYSIVRREAVTHFRSTRRETSTSTLEPEETTRINPLLGRESEDMMDDPVAVAELQDSAALVWEAAESLDADTYTVLDLHVRQGLTSAEIAKALGITKGSAYTRLNRTKERAAGAIATYLLVRKGSEDCEALARLVEAQPVPPVTPQLRKSVDRHVNECEECDERRKALVAPMQIFAALAAVPVPAGMKSAVWSSVSNATDVSPGPRRWRRWLVAGVLFVFMAFGAATVAVIAANSESHTETTPTVDASPSTLGVPEGPGPVQDDPDASPQEPEVPPDSSIPDRSIPDDPIPTSVPTTAAPTTTVPPTTTTAAPDTTPPVMDPASVSETDIYELDFGVNICPEGTPSSSTIVVSVVDQHSGVASVTASWVTSLGSTTVTMNGVGGSYQTVFGPFDYPTIVDPESEAIEIVLRATDLVGNQSTSMTSVTVHSLLECF
ncbi:MAG: sigma-70 family RNA polymerase sigma factor [Armatimonadetes bacterium]|nr:MAG: sigma-70 family RNA polymerase sigma factor [Armatimonadota bacterium]